MPSARKINDNKGTIRAYILLCVYLLVDRLYLEVEDAEKIAENIVSNHEQFGFLQRSNLEINFTVFFSRSELLWNPRTLSERGYMREHGTR